LAEEKGDEQTPRPNQSAEPMDFEKALGEFEGDRPFLMEVLGGFISNVKGQITTMKKAISDGDHEVLAREAHSIKGGAANLCAPALSQIASQLETTGNSGTVAGGAEVMDRIEGELLRLEKYAAELLR